MIAHPEFTEKAEITIKETTTKLELIKRPNLCELCVLSGEKIN